MKIKMTCHRIIGDGCIWEGISLMNARCVSHSVIHQVLNASDGVFKRKTLIQWRNNISLKKDKGCIITSEIERLGKNYCQIQD